MNMIELRPKNICVCFRSPDRLTLFSPTDSGFVIVRLKRIVIEDKIEKNEVNRNTLREAMRFLRQNLSKISAKMDNFLFLKRKSHAGDNNKIYCKKQMATTQIISRPTDSVS